MAQIFILLFVITILCLLLYKKGNLAVLLGFGGTAIVCLASAIAFFVNLHSVQSFVMFGNFLFSPEFRATPLENFFCFIVSFMGFVGGIYSLGYAKNYKTNLSVFASLYSAFILSMLMVITANNVFSFILLWEIMTLVSALFIYINDHSKGILKAIMVYLGVAQIGAFCLVAALVIMGASVNSFSFNDFGAMSLSPIMNLSVFILLFIGFGSKAGVFPMHVWLAMAYPIAPSNVVAIMSGVMTKVAIFGFIKFSLMLDITTTFSYIVLFFGSASAVFGILYGVIDNDYKKAIAYSSVENIGIICVALGVGYYGIAIGSEFIAIVGFLAALFHALNHATFKSLLFFAAGAVFVSTNTRDLNSLGGLHKKMPITSFAFLIGAISICALPPLNGFMSEWLLYQGLVNSAIGVGFASRFMMVLAMLALGVAGTLAVMTFVRVYSSIFLGHARNNAVYERATKSSKFMLFALVTLSALCVILGVCSNYVIGAIIKICSNLLDLNGQIAQNEFISSPTIAIMLLALLILPFIALVLFKANLSKARVTDPWACGFKYSPNMQIGSNPFSGDLKKMLRYFYQNKAQVKQDGYFGEVTYENRAKEIWWSWFYEPIIKGVERFANSIGIFQNGKTNIYALYILVYMCAIFIAAYYFF